MAKKANIAALTEVSRVAVHGGSSSPPVGTDEAAAGKQGSGLDAALQNSADNLRQFGECLEVWETVTFKGKFKLWAG